MPTNLSFSLEKRQTLAITGPSGSGKSTLRNILALLLKPSEGEYFLGNRLMNALSARERSAVRLRHIGLIRQDLALLPDRDALENVIVPLLPQGEPKKREMAERGTEALLQSAR